uniref:Uncharacterized protein n=1 Tax=Panagrolaimus sp. PS1159 TaxID=55785 RepID=A0AC35GIT8_9BILA
MDEDQIKVRIQYINDLDPFVSTSNREPLKPLIYHFPLHSQIGEHLSEICRQLRAPHKPGDAALQVSPSASGDLGSYLDSDLALSEQPDELQILQADPILAHPLTFFETMKPVLKCYDIDIDSFSSPQGPTPPSHRNYNDLLVIRAPTISKSSLFSYSDPFSSNSITSKPNGYIPPISNISKSSSPLAPWKSSLSSIKTPTPIIQDIVPLDNLSGTLERKSKEPLSKPWYSTSVDSTEPSPTISSSTLPRNFQKQPSCSKSSAVARSVSFKDHRPLLPTTGPPEEDDDDTIIEIPPPKPIRSYQEFRQMPKPDKPEFYTQSPEEFLRNKTLFAVPKIDLNNNNNSHNQKNISSINKNSVAGMSAAIATAANPPTFESRFPSIFTNSTNDPSSNFDSNIITNPIRNQPTSNYLTASSTPNRYTQKMDYEINGQDCYQRCDQKAKVEYYDQYGEKIGYDESDYYGTSLSKPNESNIKTPSFNSISNDNLLPYEKYESNPYSSSPPQSSIFQKAQMLGDELLSLSSTPRINYAAQSSTLPGQSIKTNLPKLPAFPAINALNRDRQTSPNLNLHNLKNTDLSSSDNMTSGELPRINSIRPVEMQWNPASSSSNISSSKFQRGAVDEREKKNQKFLRRKKSCREAQNLTRTNSYSTVADEEDCIADEFVEQDFENNNIQGEYISDDYDWMFDGKLRSSLVLRQQPALRVKAIVDKLLHMSGRDQRRALFALKQIFQDDKDLVHEFVQSDGLDCLVNLGRASDQNHQNYILRALGQLMLYVDGMNGIIAHNETIQWLYELLDSPYRLVVKTALKLLLVFVEYTEANSLLLLAAISRVERSKQRPDWQSIVRILSERGAGDDEMLIFAMTIINKTLNGLPDQDTFFDVVDNLESQGFENITKSLLKMSNPQLIQQLELYDRELKKEDAALDSDSSDGTMAKMRSVKTLQRADNAADRRSTMRRRQQEAEELQRFNNNLQKIQQTYESQPQAPPPMPQQNGYHASQSPPQPETEKVEPPWRRPQQQLQQPEIIHDQQAASSTSSSTEEINNENKYIENNNNFKKAQEKLMATKLPEKVKLVDEPPKEEEKENLVEEHKSKAPPPSMPNIFSPGPTETKTMEFPEPEPEPEPVRAAPPPKKQESDDEDTSAGGFAAMLKKRAQKVSDSNSFRKFEPKSSESDQKWKEAAEKLKEKPMIINDLDFSEFVEYEQDPLVLVRNAQFEAEKSGPPTRGGFGAPPAPPPVPGGPGVPPPPPGMFGKGRESSVAPTSTLKLHWKPAQSDAPPIPMLKRKGTFWNKIETTPAIDTSKLAKLFETKKVEAPVKKAGSESKPTVLQVLPQKRSQNINIALTKLPPVSVIPTAIRKFDTTVLNKEGIEKILQTMMPHSQEIEDIQNKQCEFPDMPLGQAEQFLLSLSEIDCLLERLKLWLFMLDYQNIEKDVAESLMELNNAMKEIEESETFKVAMGMLLSIGNALNGSEIKAFQLDYLSKASEVKDPVHKYPLTHHLAEYMIDHYPEGTDLYTEFGAVSRSAKIDFEAVLDNLKKMEIDCKNCWTYVAKISQKDNNSNMKNKVNTYLNEVAERIHRLKHVYNTATNRWKAFLLYFGYAPNEIKDQKPMNVFKMVIEFALEYRTNRDKILQTRKRLAEKRERNKTRGMMIGVAKQAAQTNGFDVQLRRLPDGMGDQARHQAMSQMLSSQGEDTLGRRRGQPTPERTLIAAQTEALRKSPADGGDSIEDELLDGVVRTVTASADSRAHERRRARQFNRKSLRRTRTIRSDQIDALNNMDMQNY